MINSQILRINFLLFSPFVIAVIAIELHIRRMQIDTATDYVPGADHVLAQPLKRRSASRIKPNKPCQLAHKRQNTLCFGVCGCVGVWEKGFLYVVAKLRTKSQKPWKISVFCSFAVEMGHFDMARWKYDSVCISACYEMHWNWACGRKQTKNAKVKRGAFFSQRVLW